MWRAYVAGLLQFPRCPCPSISQGDACNVALNLRRCFETRLDLVPALPRDMPVLLRPSRFAPLFLLICGLCTCQPQRSINGGSVNPCSTSVTRITLNVRNMIRLRCGNALPSASTSGREIAAASATTPRIPVQPRRKSAAPTVCSRSDVAAAFESCWRCMRPKHPNHAQHDHAAAEKSSDNRSCRKLYSRIPASTNAICSRSIQTPVRSTRMSVHPTPPRPVCARSRRKN